jgi:hypothetical protein
MIDLQIPRIPSLLNASKLDIIIRCSVINLNVPDLSDDSSEPGSFRNPWQSSDLCA